MRTKLIRTSAQEMDDEDYEKCMSLNYRHNGDMRIMLPRCRDHELEAPVYLIKDIDSDILIGWAIVVQRGYYDKWLEAQFYVRRCYRRLGYGRRLARAVKKDFKGTIPIEVLGHDDLSVKFFKSVKGFRDYYTFKTYR